MKRILAVVFTLLMIPVFASAKPIKIKLASMAPQGSAWEVSLKQMARDFSRVTDGEVELIIYPNSIMGSEDDVIRKMKIGQLDMGMFSSVGMNLIVPNSFVVSLPFFVQTDSELDFTIEEVCPIFNKEFAKQGFIPLAWAKSGWIYLYTNSKIEVPDDLKKLKFAVNSAEEEMIYQFRNIGFNIVPIQSNNTMLALQSGMVEGFYQPPMGAASFQWFALAPYMLDVKMAPVIGGLVITKRAWSKIPKKYHKDLQAAVDKVQRDFSKEADRINDEALRIMLENGLSVNSVSESQRREWVKLFQEGDYSKIVGEELTVSPDVYNQVKDMLSEFRRR